MKLGVIVLSSKVVSPRSRYRCCGSVPRWKERRQSGCECLTYRPRSARLCPYGRIGKQHPAAAPGQCRDITNQATTAKIAAGEGRRRCSAQGLQSVEPARRFATTNTINDPPPTLRRARKEDSMLIKSEAPVTRATCAAIIGLVAASLCSLAGAQQPQPSAPAAAPAAQSAPAVVPFVPASTPEQEKLRLVPAKR